MVSAAAMVTSLQKSSRGTIIMDPGRSLKSQTTSKPPFAIVLALRKGYSFQKKISKNQTEQELVTTA
jgi:hypothetical protein